MKSPTNFLAIWYVAIVIFWPYVTFKALYPSPQTHTHTQYAALDSTATNLAVAGKAGFALYSGSRRRWKLFGNEVQEQGLTCRGGLAWYKDVVVFPCRVQERDEEV